ncbi:MAG: hypothetical protein ABL895_02345 [Cyclobacteriaceae bacterium]
MPLRYNKILKLFAILLFSFELLAPAALIAAPTESFNSQESQSISNLSESAQSFDLLSHLIFEEVYNEVREGKDDCLISVCFVEVFSELQKFEPVLITWVLPKDRFDIQPSLYTLHGVLLI